MGLNKCCHPERSVAQPKDPRLFLPLLLHLHLLFFLSFLQGICCCCPPADTPKRTSLKGRGFSRRGNVLLR